MDNTGLQCKECMPGFFYYQGSCQRNLIENCKTQVTEDGTVKCKKCHNLYTEMSNGECARIEVENCLEGVSNNTKECSSCVDGFYVNEEASCVPIQIENCESAYLSSYSKKLLCKKCSLGYVLKESSSNICGKLPEGCLMGFYFDSVMCVACNREMGYYATGITGDIKKEYIMSYVGQVCTKAKGAQDSGDSNEKDGNYLI